MKTKKYTRYQPIIAGVALALALAMYAPTVHANVFASNIKINGALTGSAAVGQNGGATISYILNEPASSGVTIRILSGATVVRTINIAGGGAGALQGLNSVVWDGKNDSNAYVSLGNYSVSITSASAGYATWSQINSNANVQAFWPSGIAVDTTTNSPYYGRIMVANGVNTANNVAPHPVGIIKFNADGSEADEGQSNAGNPFRTDNFLSDSVRSIKYGTDDRIYFNDWVGNGKVTACDMIMTTNQLVFNADLQPTLGSLGSGMADMDVTDPGTTNGLVWMADADFPTVGVWAFPLTNNASYNAADSTSAGINLVTGGGADCPLRSGFGMMIDETGDLFLGEVRANATDTTVKLTSITNLFPSAVDGTPTNYWNTAGTYPISSGNINWQDGMEANSTFRSVAAVAIDSRANPKYVSAAFSGSSGGLKIVNVADGTVVTNINQDVGVFYIGTCFDNVGNVYAGNANHSWQAFSPPGANSATTPAVAILHVIVTPKITSIGVSSGSVTIHFTGDLGDTAASFTLLSSGTVNGPYSPAAGAVITGSAGAFTATVPMSGGIQFYRIQR